MSSFGFDATPIRLRPDEIWYIVATGVVLCFACKYLYRKYLHPLAGIPGPLWGLSNVYYAWMVKKGEFPRIMYENHKKYGPIVRWGPNHVSIASTKAYQTIVAPPRPNQPPIFMKSGIYDGIVAENGIRGLLTTKEDDIHSERRKIFSSAFSKQGLHKQEGRARDFLSLFMKRLTEVADKGEETDMVRWFNLYAFDVIGDLSLGVSFGALQSGEFHFSTKAFLDTFWVISLKDVLRRFPRIRSVFLKMVPESLKKTSARTRAFMRGRMDERLKTPSPREDFFTTLIDSPPKDQATLTLDQMTSHAVEFLVAGSETTSTALAGICYLLCHNPAVHAKLKSEIRSTFSSPSQINPETTKDGRLQYLQAVINESMRLYPPVAQGSARVAMEDTVVDQWQIPKGTELAVPHYAIFRLETHWERPLEFLPERWIDPKSFPGDNKKAFTPYSIGPRNCLGRYHAENQMRSVLANLVLRFDMELVKGKGQEDWVERNKNFLLWDKPDLWMKLVPVKSGVSDEM